MESVGPLIFICLAASILLVDKESFDHGTRSLLDVDAKIDCFKWKPIDH